MTPSEKRLAVALSVQEAIAAGDDALGRLFPWQIAFLEDLVKAEVFRLQRLQQQRQDAKQVRREIRARIGP